MEEKKIGIFIRDRRLELKLTQQQLADKLGVTDKAVSKWERCVSYPDITLLREVAAALEVNVTELLAGEREDAPSPVPPEVEDVVLDTVRYAETARRKKVDWRSWLFAAVSAGCLIAALVLAIVYLAAGIRGCLLALRCVAFGWALCYPLLRTRRPVRNFLLVLSLTILPFLGQFVSLWRYFWAYAIAALSVGYLWAVYFIWTRVLRRRLWLAAGWSILLGVVLALVINQIVWGGAGISPDPVSSQINVLTGGACFGACLLVDRVLRRRRTEVS